MLTLTLNATVLNFPFSRNCPRIEEIKPNVGRLFTSAVIRREKAMLSQKYENPDLFRVASD